jgi:protocatechuate 3,4-dioxygenase beta subunit
MLQQKRSLYRFVVCVTLMLAPALLHAQTKTQSPSQSNNNGTIFGNVADHQGSPLAGAQVTLTSLDTKAVTASSTDGTGAYTFQGLKPGRYTVLFESKGLVAKTETVTVKPAHKLKVSERLKPPYDNKPRSVE